MTPKWDINGGKSFHMCMFVRLFLGRGPQRINWNLKVWDCRSRFNVSDTRIFSSSGPPFGGTHARAHTRNVPPFHIIYIIDTDVYVCIKKKTSHPTIATK